MMRNNVDPVRATVTFEVEYEDGSTVKSDFVDLDLTNENSRFRFDIVTPALDWGDDEPRRIDITNLEQRLHVVVDAPFAQARTTVA